MESYQVVNADSTVKEPVSYHLNLVVCPEVPIYDNKRMGVIAI